MRRATGRRVAFDFVAVGLLRAGALAAIAWLPGSWARIVRVALQRART